MKFEWDQIFQFESEVLLILTSRSMVTGGWIVEDYIFTKSTNQSCISMVFIEDPEHKWSID